MKSFVLPLLLLGSVLSFAAMAEDAAGPTKGAATDLKLFASDTEWTLRKNKAEASFELGKDGELPIAVLNYDFGKIDSKKPVVIVASTKVDIAEGPQSVQIDARCSEARPITIRFIDATGQTLQFKGKLKGGDSWETINIALTRKFEMWGGANDGKVHFPIKQISLAVSAPKEDPKSGKIEFANARTDGK